MMIGDLELLAAVREQTSEDFVVYGELGAGREHEQDDARALLARERASNTLVALIVSATSGPDGEIELGVEVRTELGTSVSSSGMVCVSCGNGLRASGRFCPNCGAAVPGHTGAPDADPDEMRAAVEGSITDDYELLGEMPRKEGGRVYFAREKVSGAIAALRLTNGTADGEFELVETPVVWKSKTADAGY